MVATLTPASDARPAVAAGRFVRCIVGGMPFALPLARVAEVVAIGTATATAPRGWIGTLARNERPVPIGDLAFLLGFPHAPLNRREVRALILRASGTDARYGVTIEAVPQVFDAGETRAEPLPSVAMSAHGLVARTLIRDGELLLVLDADAVIGRLVMGITRGPDGRITELRALLRRGGERSEVVPGPRGQPARAIARRTSGDPAGTAGSRRWQRHGRPGAAAALDPGSQPLAGGASDPPRARGRQRHDRLARSRPAGP